MKDYWELVERQVEKTAAMLQEARANYSIIVLKEQKAFACWCRTEDDALVFLMAAILLRTRRQDVYELLSALGQIDVDRVDAIVEESPDDEEDGEGGRQ